MTNIKEVRLRRLRLPLSKPYRLSYRTFNEFEPYVVEVLGDDGSCAFADGHISPGSSGETREGGWSFLRRYLAKLPGRNAETAKELVLAEFEESKVAATACTVALEVLERHPVLAIERDIELPLLTPIGALDKGGIEAEIEEALAAGFRTFKIKVGKDLEGDLQRLGWIQSTTAGRATLRVDANRAYDRDDAIRFAEIVDPEGIELFEQPCEADDWESNAAVAAVGTLPLMLDEPICSLADIERAADIPGVEFCKVKLKRFGSLDQLQAGIDHIYRHDMTPVLGDGLGSEIHSWLEACIASRSITNAGEFNGFLKPTERLFMNPLPFAGGAVQLAKGYWPRLDEDKLERLTVDLLHFS